MRQSTIKHEWLIWWALCPAVAAPIAVDWGFCGQPRIAIVRLTYSCVFDPLVWESDQIVMRKHFGWKNVCIKFQFKMKMNISFNLVRVHFSKWRSIHSFFRKFRIFFRKVISFFNDWQGKKFWFILSVSLWTNTTDSGYCSNSLPPTIDAWRNLRIQGNMATWPAWVHHNTVLHRGKLEVIAIIYCRELPVNTKIIQIT